ncbi:MAG TPA: class I SAM-dependent methyltransferase [Rudaea sp.]|nr:class I SAM-dependent methyltransferase [Rudaea sp.]
MPSRLHTALTLLKPTQVALAWQACTLCGFKLQVRLCRDEIGARCGRCGASVITQSFVEVLRKQCGDFSNLNACELSAAGPLVNWLRARVRSLTCSEFFDDVKPGSLRDGIACQDVQSLTYADASFDLFTSTEVFEHVADDAAGFAEIFRVLRRGGWHVMCVPLNPDTITVERTALNDGQRVSILPDEYHADRYRGRNVFCYRNYGNDILDRLRNAGFAHAAIHHPNLRLFGYTRPIIVARKT